MPIDTTVTGDAAAIRTTATWLRSTFAPAVATYSDGLTSARTTAGSDWDGTASYGFQAVALTLSGNGDDLDLDAQGAATALDSFADALESTQESLMTLRATARAAGLTLTTDQILEPGTAPVVPAVPPDDGSATPQQVSRYQAAVTASAVHAAASAAYAQAETDAVTIGDFFEDALAALKSVPDATAVRWGLVSSTFVASFTAAALTFRASTLRASADLLRESAAAAETRYLTAGNALERAFQENLRYDARSAADDLVRHADDLDVGRWSRMFAGKLPVVGTAVTIAGIGWDVHNGKDVSTAVVGATAGTLATIGTVATVSFFGGPVGWGVGAGVIVGIGTAWAAEWAWENVVSDDVKKKVDEGIDWVADTAKGVGSSIADGASSAWNAIF